ncbi:MAG: nuclear transport factor 2 family protein [Acidobacteria bacterium]|nr:nuclear transport factor 2 family protein [Acidobacteriota bacterium]
MVKDSYVDTFARDWIDSWNQHDLDRILTHYTEDVEFFSPKIVKIWGDPSGRIVGKSTLRNYFAKGLAAQPNLKFELVQVFVGINTVTLLYVNAAQISVAETMELDETGKARRVTVCYQNEE